VKENKTLAYQPILDRGEHPLEEIPAKKRKREKRLWAEFNAKAPSILGALLDVVVYALGRLPTIELDEMPRLADFAAWITACEGALWEPGTFRAAYDGNLDEAVSSVAEANIVTMAIQSFMEGEDEWTGEAAALLRALNEHDDKRAKDKGWPPQPNALSGKLRRSTPTLKKLGIHVIREKGGKYSRRKITLTRTAPPDQDSHTDYKGKTSSAPSTSSAAHKINDLEQTISADDEFSQSAKIVRLGDPGEPGQGNGELGQGRTIFANSADDHFSETVHYNPLKDKAADGRTMADDLSPHQSGGNTKTPDEISQPQRATSSVLTIRVISRGGPCDACPYQGDDVLTLAPGGGVPAQSLCPTHALQWAKELGRPIEGMPESAETKGAHSPAEVANLPPANGTTWVEDLRF
jgi:hypothetical protein